MLRLGSLARSRTPASQAGNPGSNPGQGKNIFKYNTFSINSWNSRKTAGS